MTKDIGGELRHQEVHDSECKLWVDGQHDKYQLKMRDIMNDDPQAKHISQIQVGQFMCRKEIAWMEIMLSRRPTRPAARSQTCPNYPRRELRRTGRNLEVSRIEGPEAIQNLGGRLPIQGSEKLKWAGSRVQWSKFKWDSRNSNTAISITDAVKLREPKTQEKHMHDFHPQRSFNPIQSGSR